MSHRTDPVRRPCGDAGGTPAGSSRLVVVGFLAFVALTTAIYFRGVNDGKASVQSDALRDSVERLDDSLRVMRHVHDSLSKASARAMARSDSVLASRNAIRSRIRVTSDSTVAVVTPAIEADSIRSADTLDVPVPPVVVSFIRVSDSLAQADRATIAAQGAQLIAADARAALHERRAVLLETRVAVESRRSFWRGVKVGSAVTLAAVVGLAAFVF